jgi:ribosome-binding ATPase
MLIGLVGKPNVGKSTFFKAATQSEVVIANYPFATIKPNHGVGYVKVDCIDKEFEVKCNPKHGFCLKGNRFVPVEIEDVAGLVKGASEGKGLGNQFLDNLREADVFIQVVDVSGSTDSEGKSVDSGVGNPVEDVRILEDELDAWYVGILKKVWKTFVKQNEVIKGEAPKAIAKQFSGLKVDEFQVKRVLNKLNINKELTKWSDEDLRNFSHELRHLSKPMIIAANKIDVDSDVGKENLEKLKKEFPELIIVPCSADSELALREAAKVGLIEYIPGEKSFKIKKEISEKQKEALERIKKNVLEAYPDTGTGVQKILNEAVFDLLKYVAIFPASANKLGDSKGNILPDCFLLPPGSTALDFAFFLHTDFGKGFIKAIDARSKKALGKDYVLKNRDALEIIVR